MILRRDGNNKKITETARQMIPVINRPEETIEPIDFLSLLYEKYDTLRESTTGMPLETNVMRTAKMLMAT